MAYGGSKMTSMKETFLKWATWFPETAIDKTVVEDRVERASARFWAMHYLNDGKYLTGSLATEGEKLLEERRNYVGLYQTDSSSSSASFTLDKLSAAKAFQNLEGSE